MSDVTNHPNDIIFQKLRDIRKQAGFAKSASSRWALFNLYQHYLSFLFVSVMEQTSLSDGEKLEYLNLFEDLNCFHSKKLKAEVVKYDNETDVAWLYNILLTFGSPPHPTAVAIGKWLRYDVRSIYRMDEGYKKGLDPSFIHHFDNFSYITTNKRIERLKALRGQRPSKSPELKLCSRDPDFETAINLFYQHREKMEAWLTERNFF